MNNKLKNKENSSFSVDRLHNDAVRHVVFS